MSVLWKNISDKLVEGSVLVILVDKQGSTPSIPGAKMVVHSDGKSFGTIGGGNLEREAVHEALKRMETGQIGTVSYSLNEDGPLQSGCGGKTILYYEPIKPGRSLWIFGMGHVGRALCKAASISGWRVVAIDDKPEIATREKIPTASKYECGDYQEICSNASISRSDYVVISTADHASDEKVLRGMLKRKIWPEYVGMIASTRKANTIFGNIKKDGENIDRLDKVHSPIGLNVATRKPEEIAIAIVAEMLAVKNGIEKVKSCSK